MEYIPHRSFFLDLFLLLVKLINNIIMLTERFQQRFIMILSLIFVVWYVDKLSYLLYQEV